jgi:hypothetical protein
MSARGKRRRLNVALAVALSLALALLLGHVPGMADGLAYLAPALFVFLLLWLGRFPGEGAFLARVRPARLRRGGLRAAPCRARGTRMPRGGGLIAAALAGRAPPLGTRL